VFGDRELRSPTPTLIPASLDTVTWSNSATSPPWRSSRRPPASTRSNSREAAGFDSVWVNDHFRPWFDHLADGSSAHGGNCWTWLPATLDRTEDIDIGTGVTAVINRYHPANVAHRLATLADLAPDQVFLGIGTGESLNEGAAGALAARLRRERARRTAEAIRMIRRLFEEKFVDFEGEFWTLDGANLYTGQRGPRFTSPPADPRGWPATSATGWSRCTSRRNASASLFPAAEAGVEKSARNDSLDDVHRTVHVHCADDGDEQAALEEIRPWGLTLLDDVWSSDSADPRELQAMGEDVSDERLREAFVVTSDPQDLVEVTQTYVDVGFDEVVFQSSSPDQAAFCDVMAEDVIPAFD